MSAERATHRVVLSVHAAVYELDAAGECGLRVHQADRGWYAADGDEAECVAKLAQAREELKRLCPSVNLFD